MPQEVKAVPEVKKVPDDAIQVVTGTLQRIDAQELIAAAIQKDSSVEVLERLVELGLKIRAEQAREAWNVAMSQFQKNCPVIVKDKEGKMVKGGQVMYTYRYASLASMKQAVQPIMGPLGLSVSYTHRVELQQVVATCKISHSLGHSEVSGDIIMPIPQDAGASAPQKVGIALQYAKRYAFMAVLGISPSDEDVDGDTDGDEQPFEQVPRRKSEVEAEQNGGNRWVGTIAAVTVKHGLRKDKTAYTLYTLKAEDGTEFKTFHKAIAEFARDEAKELPVAITWKVDAYNGREIVTLDPAGDESAELPLS